jgi:hypothetical protein
MSGRLVLRHEILHNLTKPLLITVTTVTLVLNILAFQMAKEDSALFLDGMRGTLAQFAFLVPVVMILLLGKAGVRCRRWEAGLPLSARRLWWAHLLALVLANLFLTLVTGAAFLGFGFLVGAFANEFSLGWDRLLGLITRPLAASLVASVMIAAWRPGRVSLADASGWTRYLLLVLLGAGVLLGLLLVLPQVSALVPAVLAAILAARTAANLPAALAVGGGANGGGTTASTSLADFDWSQAGPSRWALAKTILRTLFKWPLNWLVLGPFVFIFGLMMSGHDILGLDEPYLRFLNFFMTVYILVASANHFMDNLFKVDHLPIDRRTLLRWLVLPVVAVFLLGYGVGRFMELLSPERSERIAFHNDPDNYGLKVPGEFFSFTFSDAAKLVSSPEGETHEVFAAPVFKGLPGIMWTPYGTPPGATLDFVSWQISRAARAVYGLEIPPGEIAVTYLTEDANGLVTVREPGLTLREDYPAADPTDLGPVLPLLVGSEIVLFLVVLTVYFRVFKPGVTIGKSRLVFWLLMGGLMALHIAGFVFFILDWTTEWLAYGFWLGRMRELGSLGPWGHGLAWAGIMPLVVGAWRLAAKSFLAVEAPSR